MVNISHGEMNTSEYEVTKLSRRVHSANIVDAYDVLPGHKFDHVFEEGFDCTRILTSTTNLVAYMASLPAGHNTVCLQAGTYTLGTGLSIPSNTLLQGMGQGPNRGSATLYLASGVNTEAIRVSGKQDISVRHLKIDGNGANQTNSPNPPGIAIAQSDNVYIKDVEITRTARMGVAASQSTRLKIYSSLIQNMDEANELNAVGALWISNSSDLVWIGDNYIIGRNNGPGGDGGIDCYGTDRINIYRNTIVNTGESSIYTATPGCTNMAIWANYIQNSNEFGIDITLGANHVFVGSNHIYGTGAAAMVFWQVNDITVQYNTMLDGHVLPPTVPCKSIVLDTATNTVVDNTNSVDSGPLYCFR